VRCSQARREPGAARGAPLSFLRRVAAASSDARDTRSTAAANRERRAWPPPPQIIPWLSVSVPGMSNLAALTSTTALALWCFGCCVRFDAGR
jgi:hypothetical protein